MGRGAYVSLDWLGPALAAVASLSVLLLDLADPAALVVVAVACCFGWAAVARAVLANRRLDEHRRVRRLRRVCVAQCLTVAAIWALLMLLGELLLASAVLVVGAALSTVVWPWAWRIDQAGRDRERDRDVPLAQQHLLAAGILFVLAAGSAVALSPVVCVLLLALAVSSVVDAWDEWRRPRPARAPAPAPPADPIARLPAQRRSAETGGARAARRRGRRAHQRYTGRRVANRRP